MAILLILTIIMMLFATLWRAATMCPLLQLLVRNFDSWADGARP